MESTKTDPLFGRNFIQSREFIRFIRWFLASRKQTVLSFLFDAFPVSRQSSGAWMFGDVYFWICITLRSSFGLIDISFRLSLPRGFLFYIFLLGVLGV